MLTAQETYAAMMKLEVAPRLRRLGFKGSGQNYQLPSATHWAMLGFQKSPWSTAETVLVTANVLVVSRQAWDAERREHPHLPERPTANTFWGDFVWQHRLGNLIHGGEEIWWEVDACRDTAELAGAILWAVEDFALSAMRQQMGE